MAKQNPHKKVFPQKKFFFETGKSVRNIEYI